MKKNFVLAEGGSRKLSIEVVATPVGGVFQKVFKGGGCCLKRV